MPGCVPINTTLKFSYFPRKTDFTVVFKGSPIRNPFLNLVYTRV